MEDRLATRAEMGARFVEAYAQEVLSKKSAQALTHLQTASPRHEELVEVVTDLGFQAAVLLDEGGRLLDVHPFKPELLGTPTTSRYEHLASALAGRPTVSNVVGSAAPGESIVAFAPARGGSGPDRPDPRPRVG